MALVRLMYAVAIVLLFGGCAIADPVQYSEDSRTYSWSLYMQGRKDAQQALKDGKQIILMCEEPEAADPFIARIFLNRYGIECRRLRGSQADRRIAGYMKGYQDVMNPAIDEFIGEGVREQCLIEGIRSTALQPTTSPSP